MLMTPRSGRPSPPLPMPTRWSLPSRASRLRPPAPTNAASTYGISLTSTNPPSGTRNGSRRPCRSRWTSTCAAPSNSISSTTSPARTPATARFRKVPSPTVPMAARGARRSPSAGPPTQRQRRWPSKIPPACATCAWRSPAEGATSALAVSSTSSASLARRYSFRVTSTTTDVWTWTTSPPI